MPDKKNNPLYAKGAKAAKPNIWSRIRQWFQTPSDMEQLERELFKKKLNTKKIQSLVRKIYSQNEKVPPHIFNINPQLMASALKAITQEKDIKLRTAHLYFKNNGDRENIEKMNQMEPGVIYYIRSFTTDGVYTPGNLGCMIKETNGKIHCFEKLEYYEPTYMGTEAFLVDYMRRMPYPFENISLKQNAQMALDSYYPDIATDCLNRARDPKLLAHERDALIQEALQLALKLPSDKGDFNQNFKEMVCNIYLHGLDGNIMEPLSESRQKTVEKALLDSHQAPQKSFGILQAVKQKQDTQAIPPAVLPQSGVQAARSNVIPNVIPNASTVVPPVLPLDAEPDADNKPSDPSAHRGLKS